MAHFGVNAALVGMDIMDASAPNIQPIWCCPLQPFYLRYFVRFLSTDQKSCCCFCAFHSSKMNIIPQPQECSIRLCDPSGVVLCATLSSEYNLYFFLIKNHMVQNTYIISLFKHTTR